MAATAATADRIRFAAARAALGMYGWPDDSKVVDRLRTRGLPKGDADRLDARRGELLFLLALGVERAAQGQQAAEHAVAADEALRLLDAAEQVGNRSHSLRTLRSEIQSRLRNEPVAAERSPLATFLDHHLWGVRLARSGNHAAAVETFQRALAVRPEEYWSVYRMAKSLENLGVARSNPVYLGQAVALFSTCGGLRPKDPTAYNTMGDVLNKLGRWQEAIDAFEKAIQLDPSYLMAWGNLALAHAEWDREADARPLRGVIGATYPAALRLDRPAAAEAVLARFLHDPKIDRTRPAVRTEHARLLTQVGLAHERAGGYQRSIEFTTRALDLDPDRRDALRNRAICRGNLGRFREALEDIDRAVALAAGAELGELHYIRGNLLTADARLQPAVESFDRAIDLVPTLWDAWYTRGVVRRRLRRFDAAIADQSQVIRARPQFARAYYERAMCQAFRRQYRGAVDDLNTFLSLVPGDVDGLLARGQVHGDLGQDYVQSERDLTQAIGLAPGRADLYRARGLSRSRAARPKPGEPEVATLPDQIKARHTQWAGAVADYREYLRLTPDAPDAPGVWNDIAVALEQLGRTAEALTAYTEALKPTPTPSSLCNRGFVHLQRGELDNAIADFDAALRLNPRHDRSLVLRARARSAQADWPAAVADFDRSDKVTPGMYETLCHRGFAHYEAGDGAKARADWGQVAKDRPDHPRGKFCKGGLLLLDGKPAEAVEPLSSALGDPDLRPSALALLARAWVELPGPGPARACGYAEELVRSRPNDPAARLLAARTYAVAAKADPPSAAGRLDRAFELIRDDLKKQPAVLKRVMSDPAFADFRADDRFPK